MHFMLPKRRFWKDEHKMKGWFSKQFSMVWVLKLGHGPLKSQPKIRISSFVHPSKIVVWGAYTFFNSDGVHIFDMADPSRVRRHAGYRPEHSYKNDSMTVWVRLARRRTIIILWLWSWVRLDMHITIQAGWQTRSLTRLAGTSSTWRTHNDSMTVRSVASINCAISRPAT